MEYLHQITDMLYGWQLEDSSACQKYGLLLLGGIGSMTVGYNLWLFTRVLFSLFILPGKSIRSFGPKGSWALITGASDGIGKEFALQLASKGTNVFLVSRTESKLDELTREIKSKYPSVQTKLLAMDFAQNRDADFATLKKEVDQLDIAILINNVGKSHSIPVPFVETPEEEMTDIITINCLGTLRATQIVTPGMIQRKRGLVLTMGSFGGLLPTPLLATYSGSKAFLQHWSTALGAELAPHGITVQLIQAHLITSAMSKIRKPRLTVPTPRAFVKAALAKIGRNGGSPTYVYSGSPYWSHGLMAWFLTCVAGVFSRTTLGVNHNMHKTIRKAALRKAARKNGKSS